MLFEFWIEFVFLYLGVFLYGMGFLKLNCEMLFGNMVKLVVVLVWISNGLVVSCLIVVLVRFGMVELLM